MLPGTCRGMRGAARIKDQVNEQTTREGMARVLTGFVEQWKSVPKTTRLNRLLDGGWPPCDGTFLD